MAALLEPIARLLAPLWTAVPRPLSTSINVQGTIVTGFLWIVRADDLDKFPIARTALVGHYHFVVGAILCSFSA